MSVAIWGKLIGGTLGFALGGPLGALIGAVAGHAVDRGVAEARRTPRIGYQAPPDTLPAAFAVAIIVLAAKMAKADGVVTRDEVAAFKRVFRIPLAEVAAVGRIFDTARADARGFEPYAHQVAVLFAHTPRVLEELLDGLFEIAKADGVVHPAELAYLRAVAAIFGFDEAQFERIREAQMGPDLADPYEVLGVTRTASDAEIRTAYRRLARDHHPDRLVGEGMPEEFIAVANEKLKAINGAYDRIRRERRQAKAAGH